MPVHRLRSRLKRRVARGLYAALDAEPTKQVRAAVCAPGTSVERQLTRGRCGCASMTWRAMTRSNASPQREPARHVLMAADVDEGGGGVASHVSALVDALRATGTRVDTVWASDLRRTLPGPLRTVAYSPALARRARQLRPDVLHAHTSAGALAHLIAPRTTPASPQATETSARSGRSSGSGGVKGATG